MDMLTIQFKLAGIILVVFLFLVKLTVSSGSINGLILFANIIVALMHLVLCVLVKNKLGFT